MKFKALIILTVLLCCFGSITAQVVPDSTGSAVIIGKEVFRGIVQKLVERNSFEEDITSLISEIDILDKEIVLKESLISQLKQDNEGLIKQLFDCNDKPAWDRFFFGFIGAVVVIVISVTAGMLIKF